MRESKQEGAAKSRSRQLQETGEMQLERVDAGGMFSPQRDPLVGISGMGNVPSVSSYAAMLNRSPAAGQSSNRQLVLQLQRQYGNCYMNQVVQMVGQMNREAQPVSRHQPLIQAQLTIGAAGDKYEQEADAVARQVVSRINQSPSQQSGLGESVQRQEMPEEEEELRMKPMVQHVADGDGMAAPPELEASIQQARGSGQPLADSIRESMEQAFGADFSGVRVHTDAQSDELNQSIQAKAFTTGQDIFFRQGTYNASNRKGQELIAHELTHVVQQNGGVVQRKSDKQPLVKKKQIGAKSNDQYEQEADAVAKQVVNRITNPNQSMPRGMDYENDQEQMQPTVVMQSEIGQQQVAIQSGRLAVPPKRAGKFSNHTRTNSGDRLVQRQLYIQRKKVEMPNNINTYFNIAAQMLQNAQKALIEAERDEDVGAQAAERYFGTGVGLSWLADRLGDIYNQLQVVQQSNLYDFYDGEDDKFSNREGLVGNTKGEGSSARISFGPKFLKIVSDDDKVEVARSIIHEVSHCTPGLTTVDIAYAFERIFHFLPIFKTENGERLSTQNAESFAYVADVASGGNVDANPTGDEWEGHWDPEEKQAVGLAVALIAQLAKELNTTLTDIEDYIKKSVHHWAAEDDNDRLNYQLLMEFIGAIYNAEKMKPEFQNKENIAEIVNQIKGLSKEILTLRRSKLKFSKGEGSQLISQWAEEGNLVKVYPAFFEITKKEQYTAMLKARSLINSEGDEEAAEQIVRIFERVAYEDSDFKFG